MNSVIDLKLFYPEDLSIVAVEDTDERITMYMPQVRRIAAETSWLTLPGSTGSSYIGETGDAGYADL